MAQPGLSQNFGFTLEQVSCVCEVLQGLWMKTFLKREIFKKEVNENFRYNNGLKFVKLHLKKY